MPRPNPTTYKAITIYYRFTRHLQTISPAFQEYPNNRFMYAGLELENMALFGGALTPAIGLLCPLLLQ
jgi:hypothetical protein